MIMVIVVGLTTITLTMHINAGGYTSSNASQQQGTLVSLFYGFVYLLLFKNVRLVTPLLFLSRVPSDNLYHSQR